MCSRRRRVRRVVRIVLAVPTCCQGEAGQPGHQRHTCRLLHGVLLIVYLARSRVGGTSRHPNRGSRCAGRQRCASYRVWRRLLPRSVTIAPSASGLGEHARADADRRARRSRRFPWCRSYVGPPGRAGAEPGHRARDPVEVPAEVLAAEALRRSRPGPSRPSTALDRAAEDARGLALVDHRRHAALVVDLGVTPYGATICVDQARGPASRPRPRPPRRASAPCRRPGRSPGSRCAPSRRGRCPRPRSRRRAGRAGGTGSPAAR